jgi:hypothetical protein
MAYKTCEDCESKVFNLGCIWCNEEKYIKEQLELADMEEME